MSKADDFAGFMRNYEEGKLCYPSPILTDFTIANREAIARGLRYVDAIESPDVEWLSRVAHMAWATTKGVEPHYDDLDEYNKEIDRAIVRAWLASFREELQ